MVRAILLALVAACAASIYGLLALWVGRGRGPWFVRAAVLAAAIGTLIPVPAYDLAIVFLSESLAIIAPLWLLMVVRAAKARMAADESQRHETSGSGYRFSLADLFLFTLFAAGIASLGVYPPAKHRDFWLSYALMGAGAGVVTLAAAWAALGRRSRWTCALVMLTVTLAVGFMSRYLELPAEINEALFSDGFFPATAAPAWFAPVIAIFIAVIVGAWLGALKYSGWRAFFDRVNVSAIKADKSEIAPWKRLAVRIVLSLLFAIVLLPVAGAYFKIAFPLPIPHVDAPDPNGYLVLARLGDELEQADTLSLESPSETQIREFVDANRQRLQEARAALELPHVVPVRYDSAELQHVDSIHGLRQLARGMINEAGVAALDGRPDAAVLICLDVVWLGQIAGRGGFFVDALFNAAIERLGLQQLAKTRQSISPPATRRLIEALQHLEGQREPFQAVIQHETAWQQHAYGWPGRIAFDTGENVKEAIKNSRNALSAHTRLLICDLAVRLYRVEHGKLPKRLEQLTPNYLQELPVDPFSGQPFTYRPDGEIFVLYSFGADGNDDGGKPTDKDDLLGDGDLVLDP
jgi:hypothetical protein